jgi:hypothetical protein
MHAAQMLSRVRSHFKDAKFARMSNGTYCIIRDLGLVKGGKGMRHHEVLVTFSFGGFSRSIGFIRRDLLRLGRRRSAWLRSVPEQLGAGVGSASVSEGASQP